MRKLISANFSRLWKDKIFWLCTVAILVFVVFMVLMGANVDKMQNLWRDLDYYYFRSLPFLGLFLSVFISMFLGTEYSDGTIRNKLIVGHTRAEIYLANQLTCFGGCLIFFVVWAVGGLVGIPYFGLWSVGIGGWLQLLLISLLTLLAITSILTMASQMITNKAGNAVTAIFIALALLLFGSYFYNALCEPKTYMNGMTITSDGTVEFGDEITNPAYIGGTLRTVYHFILNILPTGQQIWIADETVTHPVFMCMCSLMIIIAFTGIGLLLFRKKDIK
jgi:ABC-type transport system involved in multi-copper enzyme maturation permease subunit